MDRELIYLDSTGRVTGRATNSAPAFQIVGLEKRLGLTVPVLVEVNTEAIGRPKLATKNSDDAIFETYLKHANITGYYEREARTAWALYKQLTDSKPLKDATRDDGRKVVEHFKNQSIKKAWRLVARLACQIYKPVGLFAGGLGAERSIRHGRRAPSRR